MTTEQTVHFKKLMTYADAIGLTREERLEVASYQLRRDITSWSQLDHNQVLRLLDSLEGYQLVSEILRQRSGPGQ